jgi:CHAT domain-containing protein
MTVVRGFARIRVVCAWVWLCAILLAATAAAQDAGALKTRARELYKQGDYPAAVTAFERAVAAAEQAYGPDAQQTDIVVNEYAMALYKQGRLLDAATNYRRVLKNTERRNGPRDSEVGTCLNNLAAVYDEAGDFTEAEALYRRSYEIQVAAYGPASPELGTILNNLGTVYWNQGDGSRALAMYRQALAAYEKQVPRDERQIANVTHNMANATSDLGQFEEAAKLFERALAMRTKLLGPDHPSVATTLNSMAYPLKAQQKFAEAEQAYRQALASREKRLGPNHPAVATSHNNIGWLYFDQGKYAEAEALHRQALKSREATSGPDSLDVAASLHSLATALREQGQDERAEELWRKALAIRQAKLGAAHPQLAETHGQLGVLHAKREQWDAAVADFDEVRRIARKHIGSVLAEMTEAEQLSYLKITDEKALHTALSLALKRRDDPAVVARSAEWLINAKGVAQQALAQRSLAERDGRDPALAPLIEPLKEIRRELLVLERAAPAAKGDEQRLRRIAELREQETIAATKLAEATGRAGLDARWVELGEVRKNLPEGTWLIDIVRFGVRNFAPPSHAERWQPARYAAWIIPPADKGDVQLVDLGDAERIDAAIRAVREALVKSPMVLKEKGEVDAVAELDPILDALGQLVLKPVVALVDGGDRLVISPDSNLWLVPWSALPVAENTYALEKFVIGYATSSRDVLASAAKGSDGTPLIYADPDYDLGVDAYVAAIRALFQGSLPQTRSVRSRAELSSVLRLPGTAAEAQAIAPKVEGVAGAKPQLYMGQYALEAALKGSQRPRLMVVSTHGFFQADQPTPEAEDESNRAPKGGKLENPLLRCGLLLAGCNDRTLATRTDTDDGVLTGLEISGIDLRGTDLVVLSACETGLGEVRSGEGVAGLRQAFQISGARAVVSTLWSIPDRDSTLIVNEFFTGLEAGKGKADALRDAQRKRMESRRARNGAAHPFYWGAWTVTGG